MDTLARNTANVKAFYDLMFNQCRPAEAIAQYAGASYTQHNPMVADGKQAFIDPTGTGVGATGPIEPDGAILRHSPSVRLASPQRSLHKLYLSLGRVAARLVGRESAWDSVTIPVPAAAFGPGSRRPFADYFVGDSSVVVRSIDDIVAWLETCEYATDADLFHEPDVWQHPVTFERRRRGDCEDFALWAWRKLADIGVDAELCVGRIVCGGDTPQVNRQHAWVVFRIDDTAFLFEPALRIRSQMIRPLEEVIDDYVPHFAVDHRFATRAFAGCLNAEAVKNGQTFLFVAPQQKGRPV